MSHTSTLLLVCFLALPGSANGAQPDNPLEGTVVEVGYGYGNLQTDIPASAMSIELGTSFTFTCKDRSFAATWAAWYADVEEGAWLGLAGDGDNVQLAISFGDANAESGCGEGDTVRLTLPESL